MKLLLLGGYRFLGRAIVADAQARGHAVSAFNRGNLAALPAVEEIRGDRADPAPLAGRRWDAVIDTSGYLPRHVRAAAELLRDAVERYVFVSSISVYASPLAAGSDESAPRAVHPPDADANIYANERYGELKALCEDAAEAAMPGRSVAVRAGFIVGPYDNTDRFNSWVERAARDEPMLVPGAADAPIQLIDVRDIAVPVVVPSDVVRAAGITGWDRSAHAPAIRNRARHAGAWLRTTDHARRIVCPPKLERAALTLAAL